MKKRLISAIAVCMGMLALILDGKTAIAGAKEGIRLSIETVLPSLFPFIFLSIWLTGTLCGTQIKALKPLGRLCGIPEGIESILLVGFLGGYPVGAQTVAGLWRDGLLSKEAAQRMLGFCSNAGPGFLFGIAASLFSRRWMGWCLWGVHVLSAVSAALLLPACQMEEMKLPQNKAVKLPDALNQSVRVMGSVCGWIILFRVLIALADRWFLWMVPSPMRVIAIGFLELSNGCCSLGEISSESLRLILCAGMLAFGGCCVMLQTMSVSCGLSMKYYWIGKSIQTALSIILAWSVTSGRWVFLLAVLTAALFLLRKKQIWSSILNPAGV